MQKCLTRRLLNIEDILIRSKAIYLFFIVLSSCFYCVILARNLAQMDRQVVSFLLKIEQRNDYTFRGLLVMGQPII